MNVCGFEFFQRLIIIYFSIKTAHVENTQNNYCVRVLILQQQKAISGLIGRFGAK
jgi:hypothetical protein